MDTNYLVRTIDALRRGLTPDEECLLELGGAYRYQSDIELPASFANGDVSRVGFVFIVPVVSLGGLEIRLYGMRVGARSSSGRIGHGGADRIEPSSRLPLNWTGRGTVSQRDGHVVLRWKSDAEPGEIHEVFTVDPDPDKQCPGKFEQVLADGVVVRGDICHQKITVSVVSPWMSQFSTLSFRSVLPDSEIGAWGERLYANLPADAKATYAEPYVLIDIVFNTNVRTDAAGRLAAVEKMLDERPAAVIYCAAGPTAPVVQI